MTLEDIAAHSVSAPNHADMVRISGDTEPVHRRPGRSVLDPVDTSTSHVGFRCVFREGRKL
jgi:hypothetical protein